MSYLKRIIPILCLLLVLPVLSQQGGITDPTASVPVPAFSKPQVGTSYVDPAFGTTIRRVTGASDVGGFGTQVYSQLQAFSTDNEYFLVIEDGTYLVRRLADLSPVSIDNSIMNAIRWHPTQADTLVFFDSNGDSIVRVQTLNVETDVLSTLYTFPSQYVRVRVAESYEEMSRDGRWIAAMLTRDNDSTDIVTADIQNNQLGAVVSIDTLYATVCTPDPTWGNVEPDWIGVSPLGNYLIVQWATNGVERCHGMEAYDIQTGQFVGYVYDGYQHGDLGVDTAGSEFFMTVTLSSPMDPNRPAIAKFTLPGTSAAPQPDHLQVMDWGGNHHISCQGPAGTCLVTYGGWDDGVWRPFEQELFLMYTDGSVLRVAHHRSSACGYWVQPRATISQDGQYAAFASDWGDGCVLTDGNGDTYVVTLPVDGTSSDVIRIYPAADETLSNANASTWPRFTFEALDDVEWYQVWIGPIDYSSTAIFQWFAADQICVQGVCTIPADIWLSNGRYEWWMTYWGPTRPAYNAYWHHTEFIIDFATPGTTVAYTGPADGSSVNGLTAIEWQRDTNVLWYHLWVGTSDYVTQSFFAWVDATQFCDGVTCSLDVSDLTFTPDDYEIWTEVWGPQAYIDWFSVNGGLPSTFSVLGNP